MWCSASGFLSSTIPLKYSLAATLSRVRQPEVRPTSPSLHGALQRPPAFRIALKLTGGCGDEPPVRYGAQLGTVAGSWLRVWRLRADKTNVVGYTWCGCSSYLTKQSQDCGRRSQDPEVLRLGISFPLSRSGDKKSNQEDYQRFSIQDAGCHHPLTQPI